MFKQGLVLLKVKAQDLLLFFLNLPWPVFFSKKCYKRKANVTKERQMLQKKGKCYKKQKSATKERQMLQKTTNATKKMHRLSPFPLFCTYL